MDDRKMHKVLREVQMRGMVGISKDDFSCK